MAEGKPEDVQLSRSSDQLMEDREARVRGRELEESKSQIGSPAEALIRGQIEYLRKVREIGFFDIEGIYAPQGGPAPVARFNCKKVYRYPYFVDLYAMLGLHRYNMLEGTNFQLSDLLKYNMLSLCLSSYYMTLVATEPASGSVQTFQVEVDEKMSGRLDLVVSVARPKGSEKPLTLQGQGQGLDERLLYQEYELFEWPSEDAFNDRKRFYMVEEAELRDNEWICLYLKLVLCSKDKNLKASHLSKLKIMKVWVEATNDDNVEPPNARLKAKNAVVYITFHLASCGIKEHIERRAIVRRVINERTGNLILLDVLTPFLKKGSSPHPWLSGMTPEDISRMSQMKSQTSVDL